MIMTFGVRPGSGASRTLETLFCLVPGFSFYQAIAHMEVAAVNGAPLTAWDTLVWDKGGPSSHKLRPALCCAHS